MSLEAGLAFAGAVGGLSLSPAERDALAIALCKQISCAAGSAPRNALKRLVAEVFFDAERLYELCLEDMDAALCYITRFITVQELVDDETTLRFAYKVRVAG